MNYHKYLCSAHWLRFRQQALDHHGKKCADCGAEKARFDVHHLTYDRIGKEDLTDVVVLCRHCHKKRHETEIKIYDTRPYSCQHEKLSLASAQVGGETFFYWQCRECYTLIPRKEVTEKDLLRAEKHRQKYEERMAKEAEKQKIKDQKKKERLTAKPKKKKRKKVKTA